MDALLWIVVAFVWLLALITVLLSFMPATPRTRVRYWRILRAARAVMGVVMAMLLTMTTLTLERRAVFGLSPDASSTVTLVLAGLAVLVAASGIFLVMLSVVRTPEAATRVLHVPTHLSAWLYERDINVNSQAAASRPALPGDDR